MRSIPLILVILLSFPFLHAESASGKEREDANGLEVTLGLGYRSEPESDSHVSNFGLRYHHRFNSRWSIEITGEVQDDFAARDEEGIFFDVSARLRLFKNDHLELFTFFGPGIIFYDRGNDDHLFGATTPLGLVNDESLTIHGGVGLDIKLADRVYLRPDLRYRRYESVIGSIDEDGFSSTIALGYRF